MELQVFRLFQDSSSFQSFAIIDGLHISRYKKLTKSRMRRKASDRVLFLLSTQGTLCWKGQTVWIGLALSRRHCKNKIKKKKTNNNDIKKNILPFPRHVTFHNFRTDAHSSWLSGSFVFGKRHLYKDDNSTEIIKIHNCGETQLR